MNRQIKFVASDCMVAHGGLTYHLRTGDAWYADDELVRAHPQLFSSAPPKIHGEVGVVEQASAAPGEKRSTRRAH